MTTRTPVVLRDGWRYQNRWIFCQVPKGGGVGGGHFKSKKLCCRIWTFEQGFLSMKLKNLQHDFPKVRRGSKAVWNFAENLFVLVASPVPSNWMNLTKLKKQAKLNKVHILARILTNAHLVQIILQGFGQAAPLQFLVEDNLELLAFQFVYCILFWAGGPCPVSCQRPPGSWADARLSSK